MSLLDEFFDTKISDSKSKIKYQPPSVNAKFTKNTGNTLSKVSKFLIKNTGEFIKDAYDDRILWCKSFYRTDIYYKCVSEICKQLYSCIGEELCNVPQMIELSFANDYWFGDIQKKYTQQQLKRIEKEFDKGKTCELMCYEMLCFAWFKIRIKEHEGYILTEADVFKIKNNAKGEENGK